MYYVMWDSQQSILAFLAQKLDHYLKRKPSPADYRALSINLVSDGIQLLYAMEIIRFYSFKNHVILCPSEGKNIKVADQQYYFLEMDAIRLAEKHGTLYTCKPSPDFIKAVEWWSRR